MRIEVTGNIASGKTTLTKLLSDNIQSGFEDFRANPFWEAFYEDRINNAFETELTFTLQHYHQLKKLRQHPLSVTDFSLFLDMAYANVTLQSAELAAYRSLHALLVNKIGNPDHLVHLSCPNSVLLDRIARRARPQEESISEEFLEKMSNSIDQQVEEAREAAVSIVEIDSFDLNFARNKDDCTRVVREIVASVEGSIE